MYTKKLPLTLLLPLLTLACPDVTDEGGGSDGVVDDSVSCTLDAECLNGQVCYEDACVDENSIPVLDAGSNDNPPSASDLLEVEITSPNDTGTAFASETISFSGTITATDGDTGNLTVQFSSSVNGDLETNFDPTTGIATASTVLPAGNHTISLTATRGAEQTVAQVNITICDYLMNEDFTDSLDNTIWKIYGDAQHMADGYLEMTNNQRNKYGKIYNIDKVVSPGSLTAHFRIYTGPNDLNGADGFAMNIIEALSPSELDDILDCMGGIGNAFSAALQTCALTEGELLTKNTFSIEFDTFANGFMCNTPQNGPTDPTCEDHIAITLNGNAMPFYWLPANWGDHEPCIGEGESGEGWFNSEGCRSGLECIEGTCIPVHPWNDRTHLGYGVPAEDAPRFWAAMDNIEDSQWHDVSVYLTPGQARVTFDGEEVINASVPDFDFKGGYVGFTGGSGGSSNYHRFDDLRVEGACVYTGP
ncbi:MAG: hypothetical protein CMH56_01650 [Myxococcales bacterium]|nr:hypothetical protein [Myxococcales bacterium]|tara:strand:+ start:1134 stop:2558 length:1425 start_codon:yes stop_codon:yes gene_type:complete